MPRSAPVITELNGVQDSEYGAHQILYSVSGSDPTGLTVSASTFVGRKSTGNISAMTPAEAKTELSLSNVEDTALSTWAGSANITTLGTITTGTWTGTTIAVDQGGTGQTSYTNGQLLIGNTTGNTLAKGTLTGTTNEIDITNGGGTIEVGISSNYAGGSAIATVGTITSGTWTGTTIAVANGGTGATDAATALSNLGGIGDVVSDTTPQLGGQLDVNGNAIGDGTLELVTFTETGSAVNHINITNAATGSGPTIASTGDDAAVDLNLGTKGTGEIKLGETVFQGPVMKDYSETINAIGTASASQDVDLSLGNVHTVTVSGTAPTFAFINEPSAGAISFTMVITNGGSQLVTWPTEVDWDGTTGSPNLTGAGVDVITFLTVDGGTTWLGFPAALDMQ